MHLLDAADVAREGGDDDAALASPIELVERVPHRLLRQGVALALGAGRVGEEEVDAVIADLGDQTQVGAIARRAASWSNLKSPVCTTVPSGVWMP